MPDTENLTPAFAVICRRCKGWQALSVKSEGMEKENAKLMKRAFEMEMDIRHGTVSELRVIPMCECKKGK